MATPGTRPSCGNVALPGIPVADTNYRHTNNQGGNGSNVNKCVEAGCNFPGAYKDDMTHLLESLATEACVEAFIAAGQKPADVGCSSWDACQWTMDQIVLESGIDEWCDQDDIGSCGPGLYRVYPHIKSAICNRVGADPAYRAPCCFDQIADPTTFCDPTWCPSDPFGACTDVFIANCTGASECGRHKFLTGSITASMGGAPCNAWFNDMAVYAESGYAKYGLAISQTFDGINAANAEIARYCAAEGATAGECSCYNATQACKQGDPMTPGCLIAGTGGGGSGAPATSVRRMDLYCNGSHSEVVVDWKTGSLTSVSYDGVCSPDVTYGSPTLNGGSNPYDPATNPSQPPGGLGPFPAHCWIPACQGNGVACMFKDLVDLRRPCPPICMQFASGGNVHIDGTTTPFVKTDVNEITCGGWGPSAASVSPFAWPASLMAVDVPVGTVGSFSVPLVNLSQDKAAGFDTVPTQLYASFAPIVTPSAALPPAAAYPGAVALPNGTTSDVWFSVDTGGLFEGQFYNGVLAALDASQANAPGLLFFDLAVGGTADAATFDWGNGPQSFATTPSTRTGPPRSAAPAPAPAPPQGELGAQGGTQGGAQGGAQDGVSGVAAPRGAYGQTRVPSSAAIRQGVAAANAARVQQQQQQQQQQEAAAAAQGGWGTGWALAALVFACILVCAVVVAGAVVTFQARGPILGSTLGSTPLGQGLGPTLGPTLGSGSAGFV
jgi:hypothetical protein